MNRRDIFDDSIIELNCILIKNLMKILSIKLSITNSRNTIKPLKQFSFYCRMQCSTNFNYQIQFTFFFFVKFH